MFATLYETIFNLYNADFYLIFQILLDEGGYNTLGLLLISLPLILLILFYYLWNNPYSKLFYWIIWIIFIAIVVFGSSFAAFNSAIYNSSNQELLNALNDPQAGYAQYASTLVYKFAAYNSISSLLLSFIYSIFLKQFSKLHIHLPF